MTLSSLSFYKSLFRLWISYIYDVFFLLICGVFISVLSNIALLALLANCNVENVYAEADTEGLIQITNLIFPCPRSESLKILVSLEFLKGIWVLDFSINAEIQCPKHERLPLILVSSCILTYFSAGVISEGILNFSEPAKSTILKEYSWLSLSTPIWKIEWDLELWALAWVEPIDRFFNPIIR